MRCNDDDITTLEFGMEEWRRNALNTPVIVSGKPEIICVLWGSVRAASGRGSSRALINNNKPRVWFWELNTSLMYSWKYGGCSGGKPPKNATSSRMMRKAEERKNVFSPTQIDVGMRGRRTSMDPQIAVWRESKERKQSIMLMMMLNKTYGGCLSMVTLRYECA